MANVTPNLVSIMMPAYNAELFIRQAIESVYEQSFQNWELIIVNDGSTDSTASIIAEYTDARLKVINQENAGEAAARNAALAESEGEFIAFLDADDEYLRDHLRSTVDYLTSHPEDGGVYTDGYYIDDKGNRLQTLTSKRGGPFSGRLFEELVRSSNVFGPPVCVVLRNNIIVSGDLKFDEEIIIGPDWNFLTRFSELTRFGYIDSATCLYRIHTTNISKQVSLRRRADELAKCRIKAMKLNSFMECSQETREWFFYDLLVNLLRGNPDKQSEITRSQEFQSMPKATKARLYRLMASHTLAYEQDTKMVEEWFQKTRTLNSSDKRGLVLSILYRISPQLCKRVVIVRMRNQQDPLSVASFEDLERSL